MFIINYYSIFVIIIIQSLFGQTKFPLFTDYNIEDPGQKIERKHEMATIDQVHQLL